MTTSTTTQFNFVSVIWFGWDWMNLTLTLSAPSSAYLPPGMVLVTRSSHRLVESYPRQTKTSNFVPKIWHWCLPRTNHTNLCVIFDRSNLIQWPQGFNGCTDTGTDTGVKSWRQESNDFTGTGAVKVWFIGAAWLITSFLRWNICGHIMRCWRPIGPLVKFGIR